MNSSRNKNTVTATALPSVGPACQPLAFMVNPNNKVYRNWSVVCMYFQTLWTEISMTKFYLHPPSPNFLIKGFMLDIGIGMPSGIFLNFTSTMWAYISDSPSTPCVYSKVPWFLCTMILLEIWNCVSTLWAQVNKTFWLVSRMNLLSHLNGKIFHIPYRVIFVAQKILGAVEDCEM